MCKTLFTFERFTGGARRVLVLAQEEARLLDHGFIGAEHLLLGLIDEGQGVAARVLERLQISAEPVRGFIEKKLEASTGLATGGSPPFTPRAKQVLELSLREALQLNQAYIGTEHILLGLVQEGGGFGVQALIDQGVELGEVRREVMAFLDDQGNPRETSAFDKTSPRERESLWSPPAWDRPSEGTVPWEIAVNAVVLRSEDAVVCVESLVVYTNGFDVNFAVYINPYRRNEIMWGGGRWGARIPRVGFRFSNGTSAWAPGWRVNIFDCDVAKDERGFPIEPVVGGIRGGDGSRSWRFSTWVYPLPPEGPVEVFVSLPLARLHEGVAVLDGGEIRAAAGRAQVVWE